MQRSTQLSPGFVRVFIPSRGKTTRIRAKHAASQAYLNKHGLVLMHEPAPIPVMNQTTIPVPDELIPPPPAKAKPEPMKPTKVR